MRGVIFTAGLKAMLRCSVAINTRQLHSGPILHEPLCWQQEKADDAQSFSGLTVQQWAPASLRLALNGLKANFCAKKSDNYGAM
jgi:hypothetical protein